MLFCIDKTVIFFMGLTNSEHNEVYRDAAVDCSDCKIRSSQVSVGIISMDSSLDRKSVV